MLNQEPMKNINKILLDNAVLLHHLEHLANANQICIPHEMYHPYLSYLSQRLETEGMAKMIQINKEVRLSVTRYIAGDPYRPPFLKSDKKGLPKCLGPLRSLIINRDPIGVRYTLSILSVTKPLKLPVKIDYNDITRPSEGKIPEDFKTFLETQKDLPPQKVSIRSSSDDLNHLTTKNGPNGQAIMTSLLDLSMMNERLAEILYELAPNYMERILPLYQLGKQKLLTIVTDLGGRPKKVACLRRITPIQDKEGKTRIIAIGDYFSQAVLRPVHDQLMKYLKGIPQDMTFNQRGHPKEFGNELQHYHSLDLKAATDRFPVTIQTIVMEYLTGDAEGAKLWQELMTSFPFSYKEKQVLYGAGQPMGFYSSWAAFAVTHHFVVRYAAWKIGRSDFSDYLLLGDDIVIRDDDVAQSYRSVLEMLGVEISFSKTLVSKDTFEFAKKVYHKGQDVSPIPAWSLTLSNSSIELAGALSEIIKTYQIETDPESVSSITRLVCGNDPQKIKSLGSAHRLVPLLVYFPITFEGIGVRSTDPTKLTNFLKAAIPNLPCWNVTTMEVLMDFLVAVTVTDKYIPALKETSYKYTEVLRNIYIYIQQESSDQDPRSLSAIPIISVLKRLNEGVTETYNKVMEEWIWENQNPIPFRNLHLVDPLRLTTDREHLVMLGVKADFCQGLIRNWKSFTKEYQTSPEAILKQYNHMIGVLAETT